MCYLHQDDIMKARAELDKYLAQGFSLKHDLHIVKNLLEEKQANSTFNASISLESSVVLTFSSPKFR